MDDLTFDMALFDEPALDLALLDAVLCSGDNDEHDERSATPDLDDAASFTSLLSSLSDSDVSEQASDHSSTSSSSSAARAVSSTTNQQASLQVTIHLPPPPHAKASPASLATSVQQAVARATTATAPSKRPRKHNRLEIIELRDQVKQLEARLLELQRLRDRGATVSSATETLASTERSPHMQSPWFLMASAQILKLRQSEALNRVLRDAVAKQRHAASAVHARLQKLNDCSSAPSSTLAGERTSSSNSSDIHAVATYRTEPSLRQQHDPLAAALPSLFEAAAAAIHEIDLVAHMSNESSGAMLAMSNASCATWDAVRGWAFEITTCTPLVGSFEQHAQLLWTRIVNNGDCDGAAPPSFAQSHMKHLTMTFRGSDGCDYVLRGALVVRKFEQARRTVLAIAAAYVLDGCDLLFREVGWSTLTAADAPEPSSLLSSTPPSTAMQTFYRLSSERQDPASASGSAPFTQPLDVETRHMQELVVKGFGAKMRDHLAELQSLLMQTPDVSSFRTLEIDDCPLVNAPCC